MIKQIKYNRSVMKFNTFLDDLRATTTSMYVAYIHNGNTLFYTSLSHHDMTIYIGYMIENNLGFGLERDEIIKIIDKRFNINNNILILVDEW